MGQLAHYVQAYCSTDNSARSNFTCLAMYLTATSSCVFLFLISLISPLRPDPNSPTQSYFGRCVPPSRSSELTHPPMHRTVDHGYDAKAALPAQRGFEGLLASAESYNRGPALIDAGAEARTENSYLSSTSSRATKNLPFGALSGDAEQQGSARLDKAQLVLPTTQRHFCYR